MQKISTLMIRSFRLIIEPYLRLIFAVVLFVVMILSGNLNAQNIDGVSFFNEKNNLVSVKTQIVKVIEGDMLSCGDGYFWDLGVIKSELGDNIYRYGKFIPKGNQFHVQNARIVSLAGGKEDLSGWDVECNSIKISRKNLLVLKKKNHKDGAWIVIDGNIYPLPGSVVILDYERMIVYCNTGLCMDYIGKINDSTGVNIESRKIHRYVSDVYYSFDDRIIVYNIENNSNYSDDYMYGDGFNADSAPYCSSAEKYKEIHKEENRVNICSLLVKMYLNDSAVYYENGSIYFFPFYGDSLYAEYYECKDLNSCEGHIFPEGAYLQHTSHWFEAGKITTFGGFTTRYSDGYGPDYIFCVSRENRGRSCAQRIDPIIKTDQSNDENEDGVELFYANGKYYFYVRRNEYGITRSDIEEIVDPF